MTPSHPYSQPKKEKIYKLTTVLEVEETIPQQCQQVLNYTPHFRRAPPCLMLGTWNTLPPSSETAGVGVIFIPQKLDETEERCKESHRAGSLILAFEIGRGVSQVLGRMGKRNSKGIAHTQV